MPKRKNPLAYRKQARSPVEFPAARFSTFSIRWALIEEELIAAPVVISRGPPTPVVPPTAVSWDWGYVALMFTASMDWGLVTTPPAPPGFDFGYLPLQS